MNESPYIPICPFFLEVKNPQEISYLAHYLKEDFPIHSHDYYELEIIFEGKGYMTLNNRVLSIQQGEVYLLTPYDTHGIKVQQPLFVISIHILPGLIERLGFADVKRAIYYRFELSDLKLFYELTVNIIHNQNKVVDYLTQEAISVAVYILSKLLRKGSCLSTTNQDNRMKSALKYIQQKYKNPNLKLEDVAKQSGYSEAYFSSLFHHSIGCTYTEYVMRYRLNQACILLLTTKLSINEILNEVGFKSASHFYRSFNKYFHVTPNEYRNIEQNLNWDLNMPWNSTVEPVSTFIPPKNI